MIGKLKPSLKKHKIEMRLRRMPMELDFFDSLIGIQMRSERPSLGQTMQGQQVTFSYQTFLDRLVAYRLILSKELSFPTIEPNNPVIPLPSTTPSLSTGKLTT
nr:hypothetical protein [Tanacetum cinerariifolium]